MSDVLIIGGGVVGLLMARELQHQGAQVTVVEQGQCCREASWAGGGIVSPLYPWRYNSAVTALASWAQEFYPRLAAELHEETGIDAEHETCGLLMLDAADEAEALDWAQRHGRIMQRVGREFIYRQQALGEGFSSGLWMPDVANIRNPRLGQALLASVRKKGVRILEHTRLLGFERRAEQIIGARLGSAGAMQTEPADSYVVSAGAWSADILGPLGIQLPVEPVKGQMLLYRTETRLLENIVLTNGRYLIPRRDTHLLVGSTLEHTGFDKSTSEEALESLKESACKLIPTLRQYSVVQQWAGLRPGAPDGIPFIGRFSAFDQLYINAGHYRNGLVLAPASARLLVDSMLGRPPIVDPAPYLPDARSKVIHPVS